MPSRHAPRSAKLLRMEYPIGPLARYGCSPLPKKDNRANRRRTGLVESTPVVLGRAGSATGVPPPSRSRATGPATASVRPVSHGRSSPGMSLSEPTTSTRPAAGPSGSPPDQRATSSAFDSAMRGYERRQVDEYVARQRNETATLRAQLAEAERQRRLATEHAEATEEENRRLRSTAGREAPPPEEGFGFRAEKLLRIAEQEAAEVRGPHAAGVGGAARADPRRGREAPPRGRAAAHLPGLPARPGRPPAAPSRCRSASSRSPSSSPPRAEQTEQLHAAATRVGRPAAPGVRGQAPSRPGIGPRRTPPRRCATRPSRSHGSPRSAVNVHAELARLASAGQRSSHRA